MYCAWRIPAHLRCTQCSILLHLMDICFLTCICLWQISQIQAFLFKVVGPGLVSTSPAFVSSSASHPAGAHDRHAQKTVNRAPIAGGGGGSTQFAQQLETTVTAPPLVGCVVWSQCVSSSNDSCTLVISQPRTVGWTLDKTVRSLCRFIYLLIWAHCSEYRVFCEGARKTCCLFTF